jgi:hypothetical protein
MFHRNGRGKERLQHVVDFRKGLPRICSCVFFIVPERNGKELTWMRIKLQWDQVKEALVLLKEGKNVVPNRCGERLQLIAGTMAASIERTGLPHTCSQTRHFGWETGSGRRMVRAPNADEW